MKLFFDGIETEVPTHTIITRRLLRLTEEPMHRIAERARGAAFQSALMENPEALKLITASGGANVLWETEQRKAILESEPEASPEFLQSVLQERLRTNLLEMFPLVYQALQKPDAPIDISDSGAVQDCIDVCRCIVDDRQLTTAQKEAIATHDDIETGVNAFWDEQDLSEIASAVETFRKALMARTRTDRKGDA